MLFHTALEQEFPDWQDRINYQKNQEKVFQSVMKKQKKLTELGVRDHSKFYTKQELNSIDYFQGTGFYAKQQSLNVKPNIYDTRQSFLLKMHNKESREKFLKTFKCLKNESNKNCTNL